MRSEWLATDTAPVDPTSSSLAPQLRFGDVLADRYRIEDPLGEGTFAQVFSAHDLGTSPPRRVAIKILHTRPAGGSPTLPFLLHHELTVLQRIHAREANLNVVRPLVSEVLWDRNMPFLVLELVDGPSLAQLIATPQSLSREKARAVARGIVRGIAAIHAAGAIHRDLKPAHVIMRDEREPVIIDLGAAILEDERITTVEARYVFTERYAAPEQIAHEHVTTAVDIHAFGLIYHEMITGAFPCETPRRWPIHLNRDSALVDACIRRNPTKRPSADELLRALLQPPRRLTLVEPWHIIVLATFIAATAISLVLLHRPRSVALEARQDPTSLGHEFARRYGDDGKQYARGLAVDRDENTWIVGYSEGNVDFGGGTLQAAGGNDVVVAKLDRWGRSVWAKRFGDGSHQSGADITVDGLGNAFITGEFKGTLALDDRLRLDAGGRLDGFVAKLDPAGNPVWALEIGDGNINKVRRIAVDPRGRLFLAGEFWDRISCAGISRESRGDPDIFLAGISPSGECLWIETFGSGDASKGKLVTGLEVDQRGDLLMTGGFAGRIASGDCVLSSHGYMDVFAIKLSADGRCIWSKRFGGRHDDWGNAIRDAGDFVAVAGTFEDTMHAGGDILRSAGGTDVFLVRLDPSSGTITGGTTFGGPLNDQGSSLLVSDDELVVSGSFKNRISVNGHSVESDEADNIFIASFDRNGRRRASRAFRGGGSSSHIMAAGGGTLSAVGNFEGRLELGGELGTISSAGSLDIFFARIRLTP